MKKLLIIFISIFTSIVLNGCLDPYYMEQPEITSTTIIRFGKPYYINGRLSYYYYNNKYYYPYRWNNNIYFQPYRTVRPRGFIYRPGVDHRPNHYIERPYNPSRNHEPRILDQSRNNRDQRPINRGRK